MERKKTKTLVTLFLTALMPAFTTPVQAQVVKPQRHKPGILAQKMRQLDPAQRKALQERHASDYPMLDRMKSLQGHGQSPFVRKEAVQATRYGLSSEAGQGAAKLLWGNVTNLESWDGLNNQYGIYSFEAASPISLTAQHLDFNMMANGGSSLFDGEYHLVYYDNFMGFITVYHYSYDALTWEPIDQGTMFDGRAELIATETATAKDGTVYGAFNPAYLPDLGKLELGTVDYSTLERKTIGKLANTYVAMGITGGGRLYGIAVDGNLYAIDTATAKETKVGSTGLTLAVDDKGSFYTQSGEIDQTDDTFYWAAIDAEGKSGLYTVDLATGKATKVSDFPENAQVLGLCLPQQPSAAKAPQAVTGLKLDFAGSSLTGKVCFDAPQKAVDGSPISGVLNYEVVSKGDTLAKGTASPGQKVQASVSFGERGRRNFLVTTYNDAGRSPLAKVSAYLGLDTPKDPTGVTLSVDDAKGVANVVWAAPDGGLNGGYVGTLAYDVVRYPDSVKVATGIKENKFSEELPKESMKVYSYGVKAYNEGFESAEVKSNNAVFGEAFVPPYFEGFDGEQSLLTFSIIDNNNDGSTWAFHDNYMGEKAVCYQYDYENDGDDWLITPPIKMQAGKEYTVRFKVRANSSMQAERMEVKYGTGKTVADMANELLAPTDIRDEEFVEISRSITPKADANVNIGFHALSTPEAIELILDDISVSQGSALTTPDSVRNLRVEPTAEGPKVSFLLPTSDLKGDAVGKMTKVVVMRDGADIYAKTDGLEPGKEVVYTDKSAPKGSFYRYTAVAYTADGAGRGHEAVKAYAGLDVPRVPDAAEAVLTDNGSSITLSWKPVTMGFNGGYVDSQKIWYKVYDVIPTSSYYDDVVVRDSVQGTTSYTIDRNTSEGEQERLRFALSAANEAGASGYGYTPSMVVGKPYAMPFFETFPQGGFSSGLWFENEPGSSSWGGVTTVPDGDGGAMAFLGLGDDAWLCTGKISLEGAEKPKLLFSTYQQSASQGELIVELTKPDGSVDSIYAVDFAKEPNSTWSNHTVSIASKYASLPYIMVGFHGRGTTLPMVYLDKVHVRNIYDNNLTATIHAPQRATKGVGTTVEVNVANTGAGDVGSYTVSLLEGGRMVGSYEVDKTLAASADTTFSFDYKPSLFTDGGKAELEAKVEGAADDHEADNTSAATVELDASAMPSPASASAKATASGVEVEWAEPQSYGIPANEGFEGYLEWTVDAFGQWTGIDGDGGNTQQLLNYYNYPLQGSPFAFQIWNPFDLLGDDISQVPTFSAHSGQQYAAAVYSADADGKIIAADNWLVSPLLPGDAQTVSFYARNHATSQNDYPEKMELYYSSQEDVDNSTFSKIKDVTVQDGPWTKVSFDLPYGSRRFAIRHVTENGGLMLAIDDVEYLSDAGRPTAYNIYRDGVLVGTVQAGGGLFSDPTAVVGQTYIYAVTAVYADGESMPVFATPVTATAIYGVVQDGNASRTDVYTIDGRLVGKGVKTTKGLKPGMYVVGKGKKVKK